MVKNGKMLGLKEIQNIEFWSNRHRLEIKLIGKNLKKLSIFCVLIILMKIKFKLRVNNLKIGLLTTIALLG